MNHQRFKFSIFLNSVPVKLSFQINVAIRQELDLYVCLRPIKYFKGIETPTKSPQDVDIVLFRENTEDVYSGKELEEGSDEVLKLNNFKCFKC